MVILYKNLKDVRGQKIDILVEGDTVKRVSPLIEGNYKTYYFDGDTYVSAGWIDCHTHACSFYPPYSSDIEDIGWKCGVTTLIDAGSVGILDIDRYYEDVKKYKTNVFSLINVSEIGLKELDELKDMARLKKDPLKEACNKYSDFIVGLKVRVSASIVGVNGMEPLKKAVEWNKEIGKKLMVHVGSAPPKIGEVLEIADKNTIITHCMNGKSNNLLTEEETLRRALLRGVKLDVGHGSASFSWKIAKKFHKKQIKPHTISTDIYNGNMKNGPVYNMSLTLSKFLKIGYTLEEVITMVTKNPAEYFGLDSRGDISVGKIGELTFFKVEKEEKVVDDSHGEIERLNRIIKPVGIVLGEKYISLEE